MKIFKHLTATALFVSAGCSGSGSVASVASGTATSSSGSVDTAASSGSASTSNGGATSGGAPSLDCTTIPGAPRIVDSAGTVWTLVSSTAHGNQVARNGTVDPITAEVILLLYQGGVIYQENSNLNWWGWIQGAWLAQAADPRVGSVCAAASASGASTGSSPTSGTTSSRTSGTTSGTTSSTTSGAASASSSGVPAAAAAVGYNTNTFNSVLYEAANGPWYAWTFYGAKEPQDSGNASNNSDGSLSVPGTDFSTGSTNLATATVASGTPHSWKGLAFGGGFYTEASLSFENYTDVNDYNVNGGPSFWGLDIEHTSQGYGDAACWPSSPQLMNTDGRSCYDDFTEVDFMEWDFLTGYQFGIGNWYDEPTKSTHNPTQQFSDVVGSLLVPAGTDPGQPHRYGTLWVPATGSGQTTTTQGYLQAYFDGATIGPKFYWDYHDPSQPTAYPAPPPVNGSTAMSIMDWRHIFLMLGTETQHPMTVYSVNVWQTSAANNLTQ